MREISIALGFVVFLALAGCQNNDLNEVKASKKTQLERGKASLDDSQIARIGATYIYTSDVERLAFERQIIGEGQAFPTSHPQFQTLLEELVDQRLLALEAVQRSTDQTSDNKRRLAAARERVLSNILVEEILRESVTEANILRLYNEQAALANRGNEVRARHILVESEKTAKAVLKSLEEGADFADVVQTQSIDVSSKEKGGDLGWITRDRLATDLTQVLFSTGTGERTNIFETDAGWHIAEVLERRAPKGQDFDSVKPRVRSFLTYEALDGLLSNLRRKTEIETLYTLKGLTEGPSDDVVNTEGLDGKSILVPDASEGAEEIEGTDD